MFGAVGNRSLAAAPWVRACHLSGGDIETVEDVGRCRVFHSSLHGFHFVFSLSSSCFAYSSGCEISRPLNEDV
jgi:hypothetical protein